MSDISFVRQTTVALTNINANAIVWDYDRSGDIIYAAASTDGFYVLDAVAPALPVHTDTIRLQDVKVSGSHTGSNDVTILQDTTKTWVVDEWVNFIVTNITQGFDLAVTSNTANTISGNRIGGGIIDWDNGDTYSMTRVLSTGVTDVLVDATNSLVYLCARTINFSTPTPGFIAVYDISTPSTPVWINTIQGPDIAPIVVPPAGLDPPPAETFAQNWWPQGLAMNPGDTNNLFVACQAGGFYVIDVSTPASMVVLASITQADLQVLFPDWATDRLYWETSRIVYHDGWVFLANHGNGTMAIDVSTPATPTNMQWYPAPVVNNFGTPTTLRCRNLVAEGGYLYECNNDADLQSPERGLIVRDIAIPSSAAPISFSHTPIGILDNDDPWIEAGDEPILGIFKIDTKVLLANGQRGTAVFRASNPMNATYQGLQGTSLAADTNLYFTYAFESGGETYAYYSDGFE